MNLRSLQHVEISAAMVVFGVLNFNAIIRNLYCIYRLESSDSNPGFVVFYDHALSI